MYLMGLGPDYRQRKDALYVFDKMHAPFFFNACIWFRS